MNGAIPPGYPGIPPTWTSSAKTGAGTSAGTHSRVWFTVSHGILDEIYFPFIDQPNTRDLGLLIIVHFLLVQPLGRLQFQGPHTKGGRGVRPLVPLRICYA